MSRGLRPEKPYEGFPLFAHRNGQWAKKVAGVMRYFGMWADPDGALGRYLAERGELQQGLTPKSRVVERTDVATVQYLCNHFLQSQDDKVKRGEVSIRSFADYMPVCRLMVEYFGENKIAADVSPGDFSGFRRSFPSSWGLQYQSNIIQRVRTVFAYGVKNELLSVLPKFGSDFEKPSVILIRKQRQTEAAKSGTLDLSAVEIRTLLDAATVPFLKPCILLGINAGYGNTDCSELTTIVVDLKTGWLDFPRPKTGVPRRVKLWPETIEALKEYQEHRVEPFDSEDAQRYFLSTHGRPLVWHRVQNGTYNLTNNLTASFNKLQKKTGLKRDGVGFYSLRRTFATIASGSRDSVACDLIMGHLDGTMAARYRQWIDDSRVEAVCDLVRNWLFGESK